MLCNLSGDVTVDQFYRSLSGLQVMIIRLNSQDDDAQMVFESINSTGLSLTEGDKIRNFLLMNLDPKVQDRLYEEYWVKIEDNAEDISAFFRDYLTAVDAETPNLNRVYQSFKEHAGYQIDAVGIEGLFKKLLGYSKIYRAIQDCDLDFVSPKASSIMYRIHFLDYSVSYPFIMRVLDARAGDKISVGDTEAILEIVENYLLRRAVCRMPTNALNKVFPMLYVSLDKLDVTKDAADKLRYILLEKRGSSAYPRDQEVRDNLAISDLYNTRGLCACVLAILEGVTKESWKVLQHIKSSDPCDRLTIEHVMPQKKTDEWRAEIGDNYDEVHETWLHRLGNLTLTAYNSEFGCGSFEEKKNKQPGGLATSPLNLNQCFKTIDTWDESAIKDRNNDLVEQFIELVPEIRTGYVPEDDGTEMKEIFLDQDPRTFNGFVICGYSFKGVRHESRSGIGAYSAMMRELYDFNPQKIMAAEGNKAIGTLGNWMRRSDKDVEGHVQIAPGLYAYKHITNQKKVILLRQAAVLQGIDPAELAFIGYRPSK